jgi:formylglycine-generating enzyme required for sulfatase activity
VADIFISYSTRHPQPTREIAAHLESEGYSVWWDTDLLAGEKFRQAIERELDVAKAVIVIWTNDSVVSDWVISEAEHGRNHGKLIPLRTSDLTAPIPKPFGAIHTGFANDVPAILKAVRRVIGAPACSTEQKQLSESTDQEPPSPTSESEMKQRGRQWLPWRLPIGIGFLLLTSVAWWLGNPNSKLPNAIDVSGQERGLRPKDSFKECADCPEMVVVPAGSFMMGSPPDEEGHQINESPQHVVKITRPFAVGKLHVTVDQFAAFVLETGYDASSNCITIEGINHVPHEDLSWRNPGFAQEGSHPAVCLSWYAAMAYLNWVAKKTGKPYRLLTETEWEYAARGQTAPGAYPRFWFGDEEKDLCRYGNGLDQEARKSIERAKGLAVAPCNDGYAHTSPAGNYAPNTFGLYDMFGNAAQWLADCYHNSYDGAPADNSAWTTGVCGGRAVRGSSWGDSPTVHRSAQRGRYSAAANFIGLRAARTLIP